MSPIIVKGIKRKLKQSTLIVAIKRETQANAISESKSEAQERRETAACVID